ncbi:deoxyhypusine synthase [archaeon]|nr:deoxyhypusine synthase [archaeon]
MKHKYLSEPTEPVDVRPRKISELTDAMLKTGFQGRKLAQAVQSWNAMLIEEDMTIFLGLSGAMVPAGMRKIIAHMIRERYIDCLVTTGANLFHDIHEALGGHHYVGSHEADDHELYKCGVDRIYDVFAEEERFRDIDRFIGDFAGGLEGKEYSTREFVHILGEEISKKGDKDSIIVSAYETGLPVFVPTIADSSIGIGLMLARRAGNPLPLDVIKDVDEITLMVEKSKKTGVVYVGGGVPKNFIQQTEVAASISGSGVKGHDYAIQFTTDAPHWGGLSGCTFEEAVSWGKISTVAKMVQVFVDATIALPIVAHALSEKYTIKRKKIDWNSIF